MTISKVIWKLILGSCMLASGAWADSMELRNGSTINGKFVAGNVNEISFQVGSSVQQYKTDDVVSINFDSKGIATDSLKRRSRSESPRSYSNTVPTYITVPAGTRISIRTIDAIDSTKNHVGDRFQATLQEPIVVKRLS